MILTLNSEHVFSITFALSLTWLQKSQAAYASRSEQKAGMMAIQGLVALGSGM